MLISQTQIEGVLEPSISTMLLVMENNVYGVMNWAGDYDRLEMIAGSYTTLLCFTELCTAMDGCSADASFKQYERHSLTADNLWQGIVPCWTVSDVYSECKCLDSSPLGVLTAVYHVGSRPQRKTSVAV